jgi:hypothetical protein
MNSFMLIIVLVLTGLPASLRAESSDGYATGALPAYRVEDGDAAAVSEQNLLANDRFWPYQVALTSALLATNGGKPLDAGSVGVLIRVEASGLARIDFGRDGMQVVPVAKTDLVDRANRVRRGELEKMAPNLLLAIGPRLVDSAADTLQALPFPEVAAQRGVLCVFADPDSKDLAALASALGPLNERDGVFAIFFPQGEHSDAEVRERLRSLKWTVPFVYDHLAEAYTESLIETGAALPVVMLQTRDGRVLYQSSGKAGVAPGLRAAIDRSFPSGAAPLMAK